MGCKYYESIKYANMLVNVDMEIYYPTRKSKDWYTDALGGLSLGFLA